MFELKDLPYNYDALQPFMSAETLQYHHDKHHLAYVNFVNNFIKENPSLNGLTLEEIILKSYNDETLKPLFNNSAQIFNHDEFWLSLKKHDATKIPSELERKIIEDFGSVNDFKQAFIKAGSTLFGSGWAWLTLQDNRLVIKQYQNGGNPLPDKLPAILGCDVWEHSYYIDHRNNRLAYLNAFVDHLINWEYVNECYLKAIK